VDTIWNIGTAFNNFTNALAINNGLIYIVGAFTRFNGFAYNRIVSLYDVNTQNFGNIVVCGLADLYQNNIIGGIVEMSSNATIISPLVFGLFNSTLFDIQQLSDGSIICLGGFTTYNKGGLATTNRIAKILINGSRDTTFNSGGSGFNGQTNGAIIDAYGITIVGGGFTSYNGVSANYIVRLVTNGTRDATFVVGVGFNSATTSIISQSNGKYLVIGVFGSYQGNTCNGICSINTNGSFDTTFNSGGSGFIISGSSQPYAIAKQSNGQIIVGGNFTSYNGVSVNNLIRLNTNGSLDTTFNYLGSGIDSGGISCIAISSDDKIYIGGNFTSFNGNSSPCIARLNSDGSYDSQWDVGIGFNLRPNGLTIQSDGSIICVGQFTTFQNQSYNNIIRLLPYPTIQNTNKNIIDTTLVIGNGFTYNTNTYAIYQTQIRSDGTIFVAGYFNDYNGTSANFLMPLTQNGNVNTSFVYGSGFDFITNGLSVQSNDKVIYVGYQSSYNGTSCKKVTRLNTNGSIDNTYNPPSVGGTTIYKSAINTPDGKLYVVGSFGSPTNCIMRLNNDGTLDNTFNVGTAFSGGYASCIAIQSDGKVVVGGFFSSYNGVSVGANIIRLNTNGSIDNTFQAGIGSGFDLDVTCVAIQSDGKIVVGGIFSTFNGYSSNSIARLNTNGSYDTSFNVGQGFGGGGGSDVYGITIQSDGKIYVGGIFTTYNNYYQCRGIARLNSNASFDTTWNIGSGFILDVSNYASVYGITIQSDGRIVVCGEFTSFNGQLYSGIIRLFP
jgi:uncharacterized delta-60 repeat protein